jgi:hypothetical protein
MDNFTHKTDLYAKKLSTPWRVIERELKSAFCKKLKNEHTNDALDVYFEKLIYGQKNILKKLSKKTNDIKIDTILTAKISLGFWTMFFERESNHIWWKTFHSIFKIPQKDRKRKLVNDLLQKFRKLRNELVHPKVYNNDEEYNKFLLVVKEGVYAILKLEIYLNISFEQDDKKELISIEKEVQEILNNK